MSNEVVWQQYQVSGPTFVAPFTTRTDLKTASKKMEAIPEYVSCIP